MTNTDPHITETESPGFDESQAEKIRIAQERRYQRAVEGWLATRIRSRARAYRRVVITGPAGGAAPT
jgi:hypothetical protein